MSRHYLHDPDGARTADAELFLNELGRDIPKDERVMVGYAPEASTQLDKNGKKVNKGWWPKPHKRGNDIEESQNCYVCISSSIKTKNPMTGDLRYWRGEASFGHGLALMVDDIGVGLGSKGGLSVDWFVSRLPPTVIVETSPGNHQLWYFMDVPVPDMRLFKAFLCSFAEQVLDKGGDHTIKDVSRYGRLPVGLNNKRLGDGTLKYPDAVTGKPFYVRMVSCDYSRRYSMEQIEHALDFKLEQPVKRRMSDLEEQTLIDDSVIQETQLNMAVHLLGKAKQGEGSGGDVTMNMSGKYRIKCPFGDRHTNGDPYGAYLRGPIPGAEYEFVAGCAHDVCRKGEYRWTFATLIDLVVLPAIEQSLEKSNEEFARAAGVVI